MKRGNRLAREKSPYLLQHAHNPVDWWPWGDEAFERARQEDKPVFLSIGYSTCHWCHVMERESFADEEAARVLNEAFVCVKVDREERPDLDRVFMSVCQLLTGSGGWPLTILMTPEGRPFFAGTYFPKSRRWGRIGLLELASRIREAWASRRDEVLRSADEILAAVDRGTARSRTSARAEPSAATLDEAFHELAADFDEIRGGFGGAPKFPIPQQVRFLLDYRQRTGSDDALTMSVKTLEAMRRGGIFDQLGFGFHRYSTDAEWLLPHFEKMLYDQALLAEVYAEAFAVTGREEFKRTAMEVADYVLRDLASPAGGFYTAEDADSEGQEGRFYVWTRDELDKILAPQEAALAAEFFGLLPGGNFAEPGQAPDGRNILHIRRTAVGFAADKGVRPEDLAARIEEVRRKLFDAREKRPRPFKDTKILADGNGLMLAALAAVFRVTREERFLRAAVKAAAFIGENMRSRDDRLLHMFAAGEARVPAFLDDYAFLIKGLVDLYGAGFDPRYLREALELVRQATEELGDTEHGGFFYARANPEVPIRPKDIRDGAVPSGNSVMLANLLRLARLTGRQELEAAAFRLAQAFSADAADAPRGHVEFLRGWGLALGPSREIVIVGKSGERDAVALLDVLNGSPAPPANVLFKPVDRPEDAMMLEGIAPFIKDMGEVDGRPAAYVCSGGRCLSPLTTAEALRRFLAASPDDGP